MTHKGSDHWSIRTPLYGECVSNSLFNNATIQSDDGYLVDEKLCLNLPVYLYDACDVFLSREMRLPRYVSYTREGDGCNHQ